MHEFKIGQRVKTPDGKEGEIVQITAGVAKVDLGGQKAPFDVGELELLNPVNIEIPVFDGPEDRAESEGLLSAYLNVLDLGARYTGDKWPDMHCVRCMKKGTGTDQDMAFWEGMGMKLLSKEPVDSGHEGMVVMGIPKWMKQKRDQLESERTNGDPREGRTTGKNPHQFRKEEATGSFEARRKKDLSEAWAGPS